MAHLNVEAQNKIKNRIYKKFKAKYLKCFLFLRSQATFGALRKADLIAFSGLHLKGKIRYFLFLIFLRICMDLVKVIRNCKFCLYRKCRGILA